MPAAIAMATPTTITRSPALTALPSAGTATTSALSMIARRGLQPSVRTERGAGGFPIFDVAVASPITSEAVRAALDEQR